MQDLYGIWEELGGAWAEAAATGASAAGALEAVEGTSPAAAAPELSPQQLQLVQEHFDRVRAPLPRGFFWVETRV